uniref:Uncharacterized protein n=1 Tax=Arundo donax TaxID=35708 RepID=A0A0A9BZH6_ARUDO
MRTVDVAELRHLVRLRDRFWEAVLPYPTSRAPTPPRPRSGRPSCPTRLCSMTSGASSRPSKPRLTASRRSSPPPPANATGATTPPSKTAAGARRR